MSYGEAIYGISQYGVETPPPSTSTFHIHGLFSSYLGDDEFDVGHALKWNSGFFDTEYVMDAMAGHRTRSYVVDWAKSFPDIEAGYYYQDGINFFEPGGAAEWRRTLFEQGDKAWNYDDDDWICFVDATEGMSCDDRVNRFTETLPDPQANIFWPWLETEILLASGDQISLPVYAFVGNSPVWLTQVTLDQALQDIIEIMKVTDIYRSMTKYELNTLNHSTVQESWQSWTRAGWSPRMFRVAALRDLDFDWASIDVFTEAEPDDAAVSGVSIASYAYARWAEDPSRIDYSVMRPMTEADDDGWRIRQLMSRVRPVTGLPFAAWTDADTVGVTYPHNAPPPTAVPVDRAFNKDFNHDFANFDAVVPTQPGDDWDAMSYDYLQSLYPQIIRKNRRENLYFLEDEQGPVPWNFFTGQPAMTQAQLDMREMQWSQYEPLPQLPSQIHSGRDYVATQEGEQPIGVEIHKNDTIFPDDLPESKPRPLWNEGNWNEGQW